MMETQDVKVGRINDLNGGTLTAQIALMQLQEKLGRRLREESTPSDGNTDGLKNIESLLSRILDELIAIRILLASSGGTETEIQSKVGG